MIFSSTRPLGALAVALVVFGTLTLYTYAAKRQLAPPTGDVAPAGEMGDVEITLVSTGRLGEEKFALDEPHALRISINGQPLHERQSLDANEPLVLHCSLRVDVDHRLLVEAIPETSGDHSTPLTALRIAVASSNQPLLERVGWSEQGQAISEELVFRVPEAEVHAH